MFRLPIRGVPVHLRPPTGAEDLLLLETPESEPELAATLMSRLAAGDPPIDWRKVAVMDLEAALLKLRQMCIGDLLRTDVRCAAPGCGSRVDVAFRISEYMAHVRPGPPRELDPPDAEGWFGLREKGVAFRLPTVEDQVAVADRHDPEMELARRCIRPEGISGRLRGQAQKAMERVAPCLSDWVQGKCPECGAALPLYFDVYRFVLRELRDRAQSVYRQIHLLAGKYHWTEAAILNMPGARRQQYAERIMDGDDA